MVRIHFAPAGSQGRTRQSAPLKNPSPQVSRSGRLISRVLANQLLANYSPRGEPRTIELRTPQRWPGGTASPHVCSASGKNGREPALDGTALHGSSADPHTQGIVSSLGSRWQASELTATVYRIFDFRSAAAMSGYGYSEKGAAHRPAQPEVVRAIRV